MWEKQNQQQKLAQLEHIIQYNFKDKRFLIQALSHRSYSAHNNERMEFLGDSILGFIIAEYLYHQFPDINEGQLSRLRSSLVRKESLAALAQEINLGDYLFLGAGELRTGGHTRISTLEDAMEALIGAVYLDSDTQTTKQLLMRLMKKSLSALSLVQSQKDPKSELQEYLQKRQLDLPEYQILSTTGKQHNQFFKVVCTVHALNISVQGQGTGRRKAEQDAATLCLKKIKSH